MFMILEMGAYSILAEMGVSFLWPCQQRASTSRHTVITKLKRTTHRQLWQFRKHEKGNSVLGGF